MMFLWIRWFPKMYKKGVRADMDRIDEDLRLRAIHDDQQRALEAARGNPETGENDVKNPPPAYGAGIEHGKLPTNFVYTPAAYSSY